MKKFVYSGLAFVMLLLGCTPAMAQTILDKIAGLENTQAQIKSQLSDLNSKVSSIEAKVDKLIANSGVGQTPLPAPQPPQVAQAPATATPVWTSVTTLPVGTVTVYAPGSTCSGATMTLADGSTVSVGASSGGRQRFLGRLRARRGARGCSGAGGCGG